MKNASTYPRVLAALSSVACTFLLAGRVTAVPLFYVTAGSTLFPGYNVNFTPVYPSITYNTAIGLTNVAGNTNVAVSALSSTPTTNLLGLTAASNSLIGSSPTWNPGQTTTASASAYADLTTGKVGAGAGGSANTSATSNNGGEGSGFGMFQDAIIFNNITGHPVNIDVFWSYDGTFDPGTAFYSTVYSGLDTGLCIGTFLNCYHDPNAGIGVGTFIGSGFRFTDSLQSGTPVGGTVTEPTAAAWVSTAFTKTINADSGTFHGVFAVPAGISSDFLEGFISLECRGVTCDFTQTGALSFGGLNGVSFTSSSGALLTQSAGVPESGSWILMAAGIGLLGLAKWRKCRTGGAV